MRKNFAALLLLGWLSGAVYAQQQAPPVLAHAAACLASKNQLPISGTTALSLGYWIDAKSYPGKKVLYVAATSGSNHFAGKVFSIFYSEWRHHETFDIQNGTTFVQLDHGKGAISFVVPPIGGEDSEGSFISAIQQLDGQPRFTVTGAEISGPMKHTTCKSFTDNDQP
ncbi:MAG: hypothetical protein ACYCOR_14790 [Acidobacteriaceae bacterium]